MSEQDEVPKELKMSISVGEQPVVLKLSSSVSAAYAVAEIKRYLLSHPLGTDCPELADIRTILDRTMESYPGYPHEFAFPFDCPLGAKTGRFDSSKPNYSNPPEKNND